VSGIFVTGTDTGIGKTLVSTALARGFTEAGKIVSVAKPFETGCEVRDGVLFCLDGEALRAAASSRETIDEIVFVNFEEPLAPSVAAQRAGSAISVKSINEKIKTKEESCDVLVVEGAGGLLVPIVDRYTYGEMAAELGYPVVVVVGSKLGCLNHAALTFEALRQRTIKVLGFVINEFCGSNDLAVETNRRELEAIGLHYEVPLLLTVPHLGVDHVELNSEQRAELCRNVSERLFRE
jgi:dethiobiotin synthetase